MLAHLIVAAQLGYFVPPPGAPNRFPRPVALALVAEPFADVRMDVGSSGKRQRFAWLRYGEAGSTRVAVMLALDESGEPSLFLDLNRDLALTADERVEPVPGDARAWEAPIAVLARDGAGEIVAEPRRVRFELNETGSILGAATLGWLEGEVQVGERRLQVRRRDTSANGFFGDHGDQLWIDQNSDGAWAPFGEQYPSRPILTLPDEARSGADARFAVRSNRLGQKLMLAPATGTGTIQMRLHTGPGKPRTDVRGIQALLVGRDGSSVSLTQHAEPVEVPSGDYRLTFAMIRLAASSEDPDQRDWSFVFSEAFRPTEASWRPLDANAKLSLDPLGAGLDFQLSLPPGATAVTSGDKLRAQPYLYLGTDRLLIRNAYRGDSSSWRRAPVPAIVSLFEHPERALAEYACSFM